MLRIRLFRVGKKNQPFFKIVVIDKRKPPRAGRFVEQVGFYNPNTKEKKFESERVKYWLSVGAQLSDTVYNLLISEKIIDGKKVPMHKASKKKQEEEKTTKEKSVLEKPVEPKVKTEIKIEDKIEKKPVEKKEGIDPVK